MMTRAEAELKVLVKKAVKVKHDHPTLSIPAAMRVAKFTNEEAEDRTLQMRVRRMVSPPTKQIDIAKSPSSSTVSTLTSPAPIQLRPIKKLRLSSTQAQQKRINDLALQLNCSSAHKRATKFMLNSWRRGGWEETFSKQNQWVGIWRVWSTYPQKNNPAWSGSRKSWGIPIEAWRERKFPSIDFPTPGKVFWELHYNKAT